MRACPDEAQRSALLASKGRLATHLQTLSNIPRRLLSERANVMAMQWSQLLCEARERPSKPNPEDDRSPFERDYDRAVFSSPVKRLQDKAQVFPLEPHDSIRTRLTHSLEVATVARRLARWAAQQLCDEGVVAAAQARSIEDIAATCGLIHDLGNPPFGHAGEQAIRDWFGDYLKLADEAAVRPKWHSDLLQFDGNAQTLRIVSKLQIRADFHGLNLTYGTLSASAKYVAPSHLADPKSSNHALRKPGYFAGRSHVNSCS